MEENRHFVGLSNQGATCYMNSLLQTLFMTPCFREQLYRWNYDCEDDHDESNCIPYQLQKLFGYLQLSNDPYVDTRDLTRSFQWDHQEAFQQHDLQEFCRVLFDAIEHTCCSETENFIKDLYEGELIDYVTCHRCGRVSSKRDKFLDISLNVRSEFEKIFNDSLEKAVDSFLLPETLQGDNCYYCEECCCKVPATKGLKIGKCPTYLMLQLKRFDLDYTTMQRRKICDKVSFPAVLNVNHFLCNNSNGDEEEEQNQGEGFLSANVESPEAAVSYWSGGMNSPAKISSDGGGGLSQSYETKRSVDLYDWSDQEEEDVDFLDEESISQKITSYLREGPYVYELFSILIHSGSAWSGHYYAFIKDLTDHKWRKFDDATVSPLSTGDIISTFGGDTHKRYGVASSYAYASGTTAYLLVYRQVSSLEKKESTSFPSDDCVPLSIQAVLSKAREERVREVEEQRLRDLQLKLCIHHRILRRQIDKWHNLISDGWVMGTTRVSSEAFNDGSSWKLFSEWKEEPTDDDLLEYTDFVVQLVVLKTDTLESLFRKIYEKFQLENEGVPYDSFRLRQIKRSFNYVESALQYRPTHRILQIGETQQQDNDEEESLVSQRNKLFFDESSSDGATSPPYRGAQRDSYSNQHRSSYYRAMGNPRQEEEKDILLNPNTIVSTIFPPTHKYSAAIPSLRVEFRKQPATNSKSSCGDFPPQELEHSMEECHVRVWNSYTRSLGVPVSFFLPLGALIREMKEQIEKQLGLPWKEQLLIKKPEAAYRVEHILTDDMVLEDCIGGTVTYLYAEQLKNDFETLFESATRHCENIESHKKKSWLICKYLAENGSSLLKHIRENKMQFCVTFDLGSQASFSLKPFLRKKLKQRNTTAALSLYAYNEEVDLRVAGKCQWKELLENLLIELGLPFSLARNSFHLVMGDMMNRYSEYSDEVYGPRLALQLKDDPGLAGSYQFRLCLREGPTLESREFVRVPFFFVIPPTAKTIGGPSPSSSQRTSLQGAMTPLQKKMTSLITRGKQPSPPCGVFSVSRSQTMPSIYEEASSRGFPASPTVMVGNNYTNEEPSSSTNPVMVNQPQQEDDDDGTNKSCGNGFGVGGGEYSSSAEGGRSNEGFTRTPSTVCQSETDDFVTTAASGECLVEENASGSYIPGGDLSGEEQRVHQLASLYGIGRIVQLFFVVLSPSCSDLTTAFLERIRQVEEEQRKGEETSDSSIPNVKSLLDALNHHLDKTWTNITETDFVLRFMRCNTSGNATVSPPNKFLQRVIRQLDTSLQDLRCCSVAVQGYSTITAAAPGTNSGECAFFATTRFWDWSSSNWSLSASQCVRLAIPTTAVAADDPLLLSRQLACFWEADLHALRFSLVRSTDLGLVDLSKSDAFSFHDFVTLEKEDNLLKEMCKFVDWHKGDDSLLNSCDRHLPSSDTMAAFCSSGIEDSRMTILVVLSTTVRHFFHELTKDDREWWSSLSGISTTSSSSQQNCRYGISDDSLEVLFREDSSAAATGGTGHGYYGGGSCYYYGSSNRDASYVQYPNNNRSYGTERGIKIEIKKKAKAEKVVITASNPAQE